MLAKSLKDPLHQRLRRIRYLLRRSDCYRLERPVAGWDSHPRKVAGFSRRTEKERLGDFRIMYIETDIQKES